MFSADLHKVWDPGSGIKGTSPQNSICQVRFARNSDVFIVKATNLFKPSVLYDKSAYLLYGFVMHILSSTRGSQAQIQFRLHN